MRKTTLALLLSSIAGVWAGEAHASKDTTCEAYAVASMNQINKAWKYKTCHARLVGRPLEKGFPISLQPVMESRERR
jgi:hypothetical protein